MKRFVQIFLFTLVMSSGVLLLYVWTKFVEPKWGTVEVIQASREIQRGHIIEAIDLKKIPVKAETVVQKNVTDLNKIVGQETTRIIRSGEQITEDMLLMNQLVPGNNQVNMALPNDWILSTPGSLLRGDHVTLSPVKKEDATAASSARNSKDSAVEGKNEEKISPDILQKLNDIAVSYSKMSNNQEVESGEDRKKPNGPVSRFEIILTLEQRETIIDLGNRGYKFIVTYR
ncbi:SAF domain-containing protein [Neobacillus pocheonensis]|uniref:SAF domain-containing protein n=1 Tax=Neobacillus pocheonensis TaxID=363869 RepID=UPI003D2D8773